MDAGLGLAAFNNPLDQVGDATRWGNQYQRGCIKLHHRRQPGVAAQLARLTLVNRPPPVRNPTRPPTLGWCLLRASAFIPERGTVSGV
jgi:hypothetical protein